MLLIWKSVVNTMTRYRLGCPGIQSRWWGDFRTLPDLPQGPPSLCSLVNGSFPGVMQSQCGAVHPDHSSAALRMGWSYTSASPLCLQRHVME